MNGISNETGLEHDVFVDDGDDDGVCMNYVASGKLKDQSRLALSVQLSAGDVS